MVNTKYNTTEDMFDKLKSLKRNSKLKIHQNINTYKNEIIYRRPVDFFNFKKILLVGTLKVLLKLFMKYHHC